eukprot:scaffold3017_cov545-Pavlova_lutheri.AAC.1
MRRRDVSNVARHENTGQMADRQSAGSTEEGERGEEKERREGVRRVSERASARRFRGRCTESCCQCTP